MKLVVLDGPMRGQEFAVRGASCIIGRDPGADVCLALDPRVGRFHAQIVVEEGRFWLVEMADAKGGVRSRTPLLPRAVFLAGRSRIIFLDDDASSNEALRELGSTGERPIEPSAARRPVQLVAGIGGDLERSVVAKTDPTTVLTRLPPKSNQAEVVEQVRNRLRTIQEVTQALEGKVDTAAMFEAVIDRIVRIIPAERAFALAADPEGHLVTVVARFTDAGAPGSAGGVGETPRPRPRKASLSRTIVDKVMADRVALLIHDAQMDDRLVGSQSVIMSGFRSTMCVPLLQQGRPTALIYLDSTEPRAFNEEELELVTVIANQAAAALTNTQLYGELRRTFEELESAHDQLVQSEKLSTIGALAASLSHDLSNILTPITAVAMMVLSSDAVDPKLRRAFERQMQRLGALAQQLMSFSNPIPPELAPVSLEQALRDSLSLVETEASHRKVRIETRFGALLPPVAADLNRLDQAIVNVILNAIDAMEEKGGVLTIHTRADPEWVSIAFADTGHGIPEAHLGHLFKPFYTTKGKHGTGLGLFGCKRIVEDEHRGKIEVQSEPGVGTTFTLRFPRRQAVLVLVRDAVVRDGIRLLLDGAGYLVAATADPEQAQAAARAWALDAIVLDESPAAGGDRRLLRRLRLIPGQAGVASAWLAPGAATGDAVAAPARLETGVARERPDDLVPRLQAALESRARIEELLRPALLAEPAARRPVAGTLDEIGAWPLLALVAQGGHSGGLLVVRAEHGDSARVSWHHGRALAAGIDSGGPRRDAAAIAALAGWNHGRFELVPGPGAGETAAGTDVDLLAEAAALLDEADRSGA